MLVSTVSVSDYIKEKKNRKGKRKDDSVVATGVIYMVLLHLHLRVGLCLHVILNWVSRELERAPVDYRLLKANTLNGHMQTGLHLSPTTAMPPGSHMVFTWIPPL